MSPDKSKLSARITIASLAANSATNDKELVASWVANIGSERSRKNFGIAAGHFPRPCGRPCAAPGCARQGKRLTERRNLGLGMRRQPLSIGPAQ
jgi:hypothetical protein